MKTIHVHNEDGQIVTFNIDQARELLSKKMLRENLLFCHDGSNNWMPLSQLNASDISASSKDNHSKNIIGLAGQAAMTGGAMYAASQIAGAGKAFAEAQVQSAEIAAQAAADDSSTIGDVVGDIIDSIFG